MMGAPSRTDRAAASPAPLTGGGTARIVGLVVLACVATPARADDRAACAEGIAWIRDALARTPPEAALPKLRTALRVAEREQREAEFDECLDAVGDAKQALGR